MELIFNESFVEKKKSVGPVNRTRDSQEKLKRASQKKKKVDADMHPRNAIQTELKCLFENNLFSSN